MSMLSSISGIHISKHGVHIEPLKALGTLATVGSFGGLGPLAGVAGKIGSVASHIPGAASAAGALSHIPGASKIGGFLASKLSGAGGDDPSGGVHLDPNTGLEVMSDGDSSGLGGYLKSALGGINPINAGLGALGVVNAGQLGAKANKYANQAYGDAAGSYAERAGLRRAGINGMLHPEIPDTSGLSRIRSANPYSVPDQAPVNTNVAPPRPLRAA